jgi:hypothetical protein
MVTTELIITKTNVPNMGHSSVVLWPLTPRGGQGKPVVKVRVHNKLNGCIKQN